MEPFESGKRYSITSSFDGSVLDVKKQRTNDGAKVIGWNWNGQPHQIWMANREAHGFRLTAAHTIDLKALDQAHDTNRVIIWSFHGQTNQLWNAFPVHHKFGCFYIQNAGSHRFLRNMGHGATIECGLMHEDDPSLQWRITEV